VEAGNGGEREEEGERNKGEDDRLMKNTNAIYTKREEKRNT